MLNELVTRCIDGRHEAPFAGFNLPPMALGASLLLLLLLSSSSASLFARLRSSPARLYRCIHCRRSKRRATSYSRQYADRHCRDGEASLGACRNATTVAYVFDCIYFICS
jgi:hypothetical protein